VEVDESVGGGERWVQLAGFGDDLQHLTEAFHVDFRLFGHDAAVRVEVEGQSLARDRFA
jgi:hypothetical protein